MKGYLNFLAVATLVVVPMVGSSIAGTLKENNGTAIVARKVAKEVVEGGTTAAPASDRVGGKVGGVEYTPTDFAVGSLTGAVVTYTISSGKWAAGAGLAGNKLQICDANNTPVVTYAAGLGSDKLVFSASENNGVQDTGVLDNNKIYKLRYVNGTNNCTALGDNQLSATIPPGITSVTLTTAAGSAATQQIFDSASSPITNVLDQFSASVTGLADGVIDFAKDFKQFFGPTPATDTVTVTVKSAAVDHPITAAGGDTRTVVLHTSDLAGIKDVKLGNTVCDVNTAAKTFTCKLTGNTSVNADEPLALVITVDGQTVLPARTFTVDTEMTFAGNDALGNGSAFKNRTIANSNALLANAAIGSWTLRGTTVYVPLIVSTLGQETTIRLNSKDTSATSNGVSAQVLASDGSLVALSKSDLGSIVAGKPLDITGTKLRELVTAQGKTVDGTKGFPVILNITTGVENLFGFCTMTNKAGSVRVPLNISGSGLDGIPM